MDLYLSQVELERIQTSWSDIPSKRRFCNMLYSNLIIQNPHINQVFNNDDDLIDEHADTFKELFDYVIIHLRNMALVEEFITKFVNEHSSFCSLADKYLDTMGNCLLDTHKQILGDGFDKDMELAWIRVYVFIANYILKLTEEPSDAESASSLTDIEPLKIGKSPMTPNTPLTPIMDEDAAFEENTQDSENAETINTIKFLLSSNSKYRGFRRSSNIPKDEPITVSVPPSRRSTLSPGLRNSLSKKVETVCEVDENFDPRNRRRLSNATSFVTVKSQSPPSSIGDDKDETFDVVDSLSGDSSDEYEERNEREDEFSTPKPSFTSDRFRSPLLQRLREKQQWNAIDEDESDEEREQEEHQRKVHQQREEQKQRQWEHERQQMELARQMERLHPVEEEKPRLNLRESFPTIEQDDEPFDPRRRIRSRFNQPVKLSLRELTSSEEDLSTPFQQPGVPQRSPARLMKHAASTECFGLKGLAPIVEHEDKFIKSDTSSSRTSSLSLGASHSHSGSSMSSTTEDNSYSKPVAQSRNQQSSLCNLRYASSTPSLISEPNTPNRASLGFMRSSFVLKKEMDQLGYNIPENVSGNSGDILMAPVKLEAPRPQVHLLANDSMYSFEPPVKPDNSDDVSSINPFEIATANTSMSSEKSSRTSLRKKLGSLFSSKSSSQPAKRSTSKTTVKSSGASVITVDPKHYSSRNTSGQTSMFTARQMPEPPRNPFTPSVTSRSDCRSVASTETRSSTISGFSLLKKSDKRGVKYTLPEARHTSRGNRYVVTKVPYNIFT
ncbi:uncharacterized protein SPAPADRAFT_50180 [Spathaspora passalidarum NRRL Y-27907]|uniref:Globin domain-containing protein n=1 Tax=Spathaspora passalidarum (strain NRRL Y-27907 / 11-Y1) TaxID=619300 RepID=G3ALN8_SPAPN|nr:uncharacterized protein SPAPADRAFT_50180 [Spathaspora passalidarum NRRL Y-27907]EGW33281.1 hypothetical protein SPAPADRAFT_50180 [Spathaspora passalidarum NRRL Y-27907]